MCNCFELPYLGLIKRLFTNLFLIRVWSPKVSIFTDSHEYVFTFVSTHVFSFVNTALPSSCLPSSVCIFLRQYCAYLRQWYCVYLSSVLCFSPSLLCFPSSILCLPLSVLCFPLSVQYCFYVCYNCVFHRYFDLHALLVSQDRRNLFVTPWT
jgi:hypothetical protein